MIPKEVLQKSVHRDRQAIVDSISEVTTALLKVKEWNSPKLGYIEGDDAARSIECHSPYEILMSKARRRA